MNHTAELTIAILPDGKYDLNVTFQKPAPPPEQLTSILASIERTVAVMGFDAGDFTVIVGPDGIIIDAVNRRQDD
jgi:hypothetical protein